MYKTLLTATFISSIITAAGASAHPWTRVVQNEGELCSPVINEGTGEVEAGAYIPYMVDRKNSQGETVTLSFDSAAQRQLCKLVNAFPR